MESENNQVMWHEKPHQKSSQNESEHEQNALEGSIKKHVSIIYRIIVRLLLMISSTFTGFLEYAHSYFEQRLSYVIQIFMSIKIFLS